MWDTPRARALVGAAVVDIVEQEIRDSAAPGAPADVSFVRNAAVAVAALVESLLVSKRRAAQPQHPRPDRSVQARRSTSLRAQHRLRLGITRHVPQAQTRASQSHAWGADGCQLHLCARSL